MKCFYHMDLDGECSGAIVKNKFPECEMFPINYGMPFPFEIINFKEVVYMVDFGLQPFDLMMDLNDKADLIWIDHHETAIKESEKWDIDIKGKRQSGISACELTWSYLNSTEVPKGVKLLGLYDIWDHRNLAVVPFQYGMRSYITNPDHYYVWNFIFNNNEQFISDTISDGNTILSYLRKENSNYMDSYLLKCEWENYNCIVANRGMTGSMLFDSVESDYDVMITFCRLPSKQWTVSLYSTKESVNVGKIAKKYGGGGHANAAGFQCKSLPFKV